MLKFYKISLVLYITMALFSFYLAYNIWNEPGNKKYIMLLFGFIATAMFFFRRSFIKKLEKKNEL